MHSKKEPKLLNYQDNSEEIDISLLLLNLSLTYEERIERHEDARELLEQLRIAGEHAIEINLHGKMCKVISLEDLITSKRALGRYKDLVVAQELEIIKNTKT